MKMRAVSAILAACGVALALTTTAAQRPTGQPADKALIDELVLANRMLASQDLGVLDALGHVSVRSRTNANHFYISHSIAPGPVTATDIIENDLDSAPVAGARDDQYQERFIHGEIYVGQFGRAASGHQPGRVHRRRPPVPRHPQVRSARNNHQESRAGSDGERRSRQRARPAVERARYCVDGSVVAGSGRAGLQPSSQCAGSAAGHRAGRDDCVSPGGARVYDAGNGRGQRYQSRVGVLEADHSGQLT